MPPRASHNQWRALWFRKNRLCLAARIAEQSVPKRCSAIWPRERLPPRHADPDAYLGVPGVSAALRPAAQQHRVSKHSYEAPVKAHWLMVLGFGSSARLSSSFPVPTSSRVLVRSTEPEQLRSLNHFCSWAARKPMCLQTLLTAKGTRRCLHLSSSSGRQAGLTAGTAGSCTGPCGAVYKPTGWRPGDVQVTRASTPPPRPPC